MFIFNINKMTYIILHVHRGCFDPVGTVTGNEGRGKVTEVGKLG